MSPRLSLPLGGQGDISIQKITPASAAAAARKSETATGIARRKPLPKSTTWRASTRIRLHSGQTVQREVFSRVSGDAARTKLREILADPATFAPRTIRASHEPRSLSGATTLAEFFPLWVESERRRRKPIRAQTLNEYERIGRKNILGPDGIGSLKLSEISVTVVSDLLSALLNGTATERPKPSLAKQVRVILSNTLRYALHRGLIPVNPVHDATTVTIETGTPVAITVDTAADLRQAVRAWAATPYADNNPYADPGLLPPFVDLLLATAMRPGEVLALRWDEDLDLDSKPATVAVSGTIIFLKGGDSTGRSTVRQNLTKTDRGYRQLALAPAVVDMLQKRRENRPEDQFVFGHKNGGPLASTSLRILWRAAIEGTPAQGLTPRDARKIGATLIARVSGIASAAGQLGNTEAVARKHYVEPPALHNNLEVLAALVADPVTAAEVDLTQRLQALQDAAAVAGVQDLRVVGLPGRITDGSAPLTLLTDPTFNPNPPSNFAAIVEEILGAPLTVTEDSIGSGYLVMDAFSGAATLTLPFK